VKKQGLAGLPARVTALLGQRRTLRLPRRPCLPWPLRRGRAPLHGR
jgi:hypothetical protein